MFFVLWLLSGCIENTVSQEGEAMDMSVATSTPDATPAAQPAGEDEDGDDVSDVVDNCPMVANANQLDTDNDGDGNLCDACPLDADNDADGDGRCFDVDNCPEMHNPDQLDRDDDGIGDACDNFTQIEPGRCIVRSAFEVRDSDTDEVLETGEVTTEVACCNIDNDCQGSPNGPFCVLDAMLAEAIGEHTVATCQPCLQLPLRFDARHPGCDQGETCVWGVSDLTPDGYVDELLSRHGSGLVGLPNQSVWWCEEL
ncbi:MAG: thrombospondin type 3 repeat-containing protein [Candidatus Magasanikbacteria bacterium]|jgi:hypothetical protein|nr:thrombospondin type 3 repeat-containing protein [Candidatus Magasanikbacteria bacterium]